MRIISRRLSPRHCFVYFDTIETLAYPLPPILDAEDSKRDLLKDIDRLIEDARDLSQQELLDQVYRRVTIYLCSACYNKWIENPIG